MSAPQPLSAAALADIVNRRQRSARDVVTEALDRIERHDPCVNAFTDVLAGRALARADALDEALNRGGPSQPLAGVPFAVKNLIDIAGLPTRAGSKINRERPPAERDGALLRRLEAAGAVLARGGRTVTAADLPAEYRGSTRAARLRGMEQAERQAILAALAAADGNKSRAATALGISRTTLYARIRALGIRG